MGETAIVVAEATDEHHSLHVHEEGVVVAEAHPVDEHHEDADGDGKAVHFDDEDGLFPIQQFKIYLFVMDDLLWSLIFMLSQLFFWIWGWPNYIEYGYKDWMDATHVNEESSGSIVSGPSGSGIFPVSTLLMIFAMVIWTGRYFLYDAQKEHPEIQV